MDPAAFPNMGKLFEGTSKQRLQLLRSWLTSGEAASKCEIQLEVVKSWEKEGQNVESLLTIEGMRKEGVSEFLGFNYIYIYLFILTYYRYMNMHILYVTL